MSFFRRGIFSCIYIPYPAPCIVAGNCVGDAHMFLLLMDGIARGSMIGAARKPTEVPVGEERGAA
jgi:hypothetical protein